MNTMNEKEQKLADAILDAALSHVPECDGALDRLLCGYITLMQAAQTRVATELARHEPLTPAP